MRIKYLLLVGLLFLFSDCQKDGDIQFQEDDISQNNLVSGDAEPDLINHLESILSSENSLKWKNLNLPFDKKWINKKSIKKIKNPETGYTNFSFSIKKRKRDPWVFNILVTKYGHKDFSEPIVLKYLLDEEFNKAVNQKRADWSTYRGKIQQYSIYDVDDRFFEKNKELADPCNTYNPPSGNPNGIPDDIPGSDPSDYPSDGDTPFDPGGTDGGGTSGGGGSFLFCEQVPSPICNTCFQIQCITVYYLNGDDPCDPPTGPLAPNEPILDIDIAESLLEDNVSYATQQWLAQTSNYRLRNQIINNLIKYIDDPIAQIAIYKHSERLAEDQAYAALVEASFSWSGIMWDIAKELIGDKAVDLFSSVVGIKDVQDAIKAMKNEDWGEFVVEVSKLAGKTTPLGKIFKMVDAGSEMYTFVKKLDKFWDKVEGYSTQVVEKMWTIASKYGDDLKVNSKLIGSLLKTINRGLKSAEEVVSSIQPFDKISVSNMKHILHGDGITGLHHTSGLVKFPDTDILKYDPPKINGVYRIIHGPNSKESTMFPEHWSEIEVAEAIKMVYQDQIENIQYKGSSEFLKGTFNNVEIRLNIKASNKTITTAFPIY